MEVEAGRVSPPQEVVPVVMAAVVAAVAVVAAAISKNQPVAVAAEWEVQFEAMAA